MRKDDKKEKFKKQRKRVVSFLTALMMIGISVPTHEYSELIEDGAFSGWWNWNPLGSAIGRLIHHYESNVLNASAEGETPTKGIEDELWDNKTSITFGNVNELIDYSYWYANNENFAAFHKNDSITLAFQNSYTLVPYNNGTGAVYHPLGTAASPFDGSISFSVTTGVYSYTLTSPVPLFDYISDDAVIGSSAVTLHLISTTNSEVLFANHVKHDSGSAAWHLVLDSTNTTTYSSVIGSMESDAVVSLNFENASGCAVSATSGVADLCNAGTVCGTMKPGSHLTVDLSVYIPREDNTKINLPYNVASTNGHAGGLVGEMQGATLTLKSIPPASNDTEITSTSQYAGGLVGYAVDSVVEMAKGENNTILFQVDGAAASEIPVLGSVKALNAGAGGVFGYYKNTQGTSATPQGFDLAKYNNAATVDGTYCGGVFGVLENNKGESESAISLTIKNTNSAGTLSISSSSTGNASGYFGGIAGKYITDALSNSLVLDGLTLTANAYATYSAFGGTIGIADSAAYIQTANTMNVTATGTDKATYFGGLVGATSADHGVFVDLGSFKLNAGTTENDTFTAEEFKGGGVVGLFNNGVLRLSGTTDMSSAKPASAVNCGQLVGKNDNVLTYAASGWTFSRSSGALTDDLGTWGEVVRIADIEDTSASPSANAILTLDPTAHTIIVKDAAPSMGTPVDFAKTALNIQLNQGSDYDCLKFTSGNNTRSYLLGTGLSLSADISLSNTGITGFMRDGGDVSAIGSFTGTFDGNGHTITLATGEKYGNGVTASTNSEGIGQIYRHQHNGLFAVLAGKVNSLTVDGTITVRNHLDIPNVNGTGAMNIGGIASRNGGDVTLNSVKTNVTIKYHECVNIGTQKYDGKDYAPDKNVGGFIGYVGTNGAITISGKSEIKKSTSESGSQFVISGYHQGGWNVYGGAIGKIAAEEFTVDIGTKDDDDNKLTNSLTVDISGVTNSGGNSDSGGLIGYITAVGSYGSRTVNLNNVEFSSCTVGNAASANGGGFLGYAWLNTTTNVNGVTVTSGTINNSTAPNVGVMLYSSTGKMKVDSLEINGLTMSAGGGASLGMIVNKAYDSDNGLYLDVLNAGYTLTGSGISLPSSLGVFDELAAFSASNVLNGGKGAGVISVNMNSARTGTEPKITVTGTYQNQLTSTSSRAITAAKYANDKSRYYYNLDVLNNSDAGQDLLLWSVNKYAASNIADEFESTTDHPFGTTITNTLSGNTNMTGLSFYPLKNMPSGTILNNLTLTMDYASVYTTAEGVFNSVYNRDDSYNRDPGATNQHYLMHSGLFIDQPEGSNLSFGGTNTFCGNFLQIAASTNDVGYNGLLVSRVSNGSLTSASGSKIVLDGIVAKTTGNTAYNNVYLLVNQITRADILKASVSVYLEGISATSSYSNGSSTVAVAKSLIGDVSGPAIDVEFSKIKLDSRTNGTLSANSALKTAYGTENSIFTESTLLASLKTTPSAQLRYYYYYDEDWGGTGSRWVTYGKEVKSSLEYAGKEEKYYTSGYFTDPVTAARSTGVVYDFSSGFLPYVKKPYDNSDPDQNGCYYRELKVNVSSAGLTDGCGTYNHPYIITSGEQLVSVAALLNSSDASALANIRLPITEKSGLAANTTGNRWCEEDCATFTGSNATYTQDAGSKTWALENVKLYLANAYYKINSNAIITLPDSFAGLGGTDSSGKFAFRGVIVGSTTSGVPNCTVINNSSNPFIKVSNGSVVKDLVIKQGIDVEVKGPAKTGTTDAYFGYDSKCNYYGIMFGEIMGGDNIIDNSYVEQNSGKKVSLTGTYGMLCPVGSYAGVVVFGGLIFKNMNTGSVSTNSSGFTVNYETDTTNLTLETSKGAIYVNPLVGRVINGYAVNETTDTFSVTENGHYHDDENRSRTGTIHLLKNTRKHYTIADIYQPTSDEDKLYVEKVSTASEDGIIKVPNSQALFILSLITQSVAGTAQKENVSGKTTTETINGTPVERREGNTIYITIDNTINTVTTGSGIVDYSNSLSYGINSNNVYGTSHAASYSAVGTGATDKTTVEDYSVASEDTASLTAVPYIIRHYTKNIDIDDTQTTSTSETETSTETIINKNEYVKYTGTNESLHGQSFVLSITRNNVTQYFGNEIVSSSPTKISKIYGDNNTNKQKSGDPDQAALYTFEKVDGTTNKYYISTIKNGTKNYMCMTGTGNPGHMSFSTEQGTVFTVSNHGARNNNAVDDYAFFISNPNNVGLNMFNELNGDGFAGWTGNSDVGAAVVLYTRVPPAEPTTTITTITTTTTTTNRTTKKQSYPARCVTNKTANCYYDIKLTGSEPYQLPDSYRGIGCVGNGNDDYCIKLDEFNGNGLTIDEDIYFNRFFNQNNGNHDNYFDKLHTPTSQSCSANTASFNGATSQDNHGIGLFNEIKMKDQNSKFDNFTMKGSVNTETYGLGTSPAGAETKGMDDNQAIHWLVTGGVCGWSPKDCWCSFEDIALNNLTISGSTQAAGLLASSGLNNDITRKVVATRCSADEISVEVTSGYKNGDARCVVAPLIGKVDQGKVVVDGGEGGSIVSIKAVKSVNSLNCVAAGLVGYAGNGCEASNMTVRPASSLGATVLTIGQPNNRMAGGIVALMQPAVQYASSCIASFENCTVERINIQANYYAGGLYGGTWNASSGEGWITNKVSIKNCEIIGNANTPNTISATNCAGGFIADGLVYSGDSPNIEIADSKISNYKISNTAVDTEIKARERKEAVGVGGFIGFADAQEADASVTCYIHDCAAIDCEITAANGSAGGVIGQVTYSTANRILGYNILLDNISTRSANMGTWVGYMASDDTTTSIQFTGVAIYGIGYEKNIGNWSLADNQNNANASFVFAAYDENKLNTGNSQAKPPVSSLNKGSTVEMPKSPYVNINPQSSLGADEIISGDGAVLYGQSIQKFNGKTGDKTMAAKIYADLDDTTNTRRYATFQNAPIVNKDGGSNTFESFFQQTAGSNGNRISTYWIEKGITDSDNVGYDDFPVVVIANQDSTETTNLINRYIQLVTNTTKNYAASDDYFNIVVKSCTYDDESDKFVLGTSAEAGLIFSAPNFTLNAAGIDSLAENKFTLIDVQFLDPLTAGTATEKIAYHLYVPVYTIKSLNATFSSTAASGTNYKDSEYSLPATKDKLVMESFDNWITARFQYRYPASEMQVLVDSEMLGWNSDKEIVLKHDTSVTGTALSPNTELILIDANGGADKAYYAKGSELDPSTTDSHNTSLQHINLSVFHTGYTGGTVFSEQKIRDLLGDFVTVNEIAGSGKYEEVNVESGYDIKVGTRYYKYNQDSVSGHKITVTQAYTEAYYLSVRMPQDTKVYMFSVRSADELTGTIRTYVGSEYYTGSMLFGDLYDQNMQVTAVQSPDKSDLITEANNKITINVESTIKLKETNASFYADRISDPPKKSL